MRKFVVAIGALMVGLAFTAAPAGAHTAGTVHLPSGTVTCALSGHGTFTPALPSAANEAGSPVPIVFKFKATIGSCDDSGVVGGKHPITTGLVQFSATLPEGSGCGDLLTLGTPDFTTNVNKLAVKWQGLVGTRPTLVGCSNGVVSGTSQIIKGWELTSDPLALRSAFVDETVTMDLVFANLAAIGGCAFGGPALSSVDATTAGSTISVAP